MQSYISRFAQFLFFASLFLLVPAMIGGHPWGGALSPAKLSPNYNHGMSNCGGDIYLFGSANAQQYSSPAPAVPSNPLSNGACVINLNQLAAQTHKPGGSVTVMSSNGVPQRLSGGNLSGCIKALFNPTPGKNPICLARWWLTQEIFGHDLNWLNEKVFLLNGIAILACIVLLALSIFIPSGMMAWEATQRIVIAAIFMWLQWTYYPNIDAVALYLDYSMACAMINWEPLDLIVVISVILWFPSIFLANALCLASPQKGVEKAVDALLMIFKAILGKMLEKFNTAAKSFDKFTKLKP